MASRAVRCQCIRQQKNKMKFFLPFATIFLFSFIPQEKNYNFSKPDSYYILPDTLHEISGLTDIDDGRIGCVQDEKGMVFVYNLYQSRIESRHTFYLDGDYEGITLVKDDMYVLRSNGTLFCIRNFFGDTQKVDSFQTNIQNINNEGLCYHAKRKTLLIASKSRINRQPEQKDKRYIYEFDIKTNKTMDEPFLVLDVNDIEVEMSKRNISLGERQKKTGESIDKRLKFMPSSIAVHPVNGYYYIISAVDFLMIAVDDKGEIKDMVKFDEALFPKPEGLTFFTNGDMFISNEGKDKKPNLLRFNYSR